ncbi:hypothetical protein [Saccharopolyspora erythraea]|uniref:Uncharacterized protein n=1 Tax=Saccharopolyspora erythraea (strain ATCC 11635 / DSM 40517 / JCM 4748 / NBRC 13426 / NCIMB 8594 / NRRL 2338) TaxID=405948 RepID=A4FHC7_SACEN|nr:hypothetical protein [Saccharopolyspora erythraea]EQD86880.1 hypothetical protein N599_07415 [Saccharopolyspora erythraea D]QRK87355.1 hypothetical protein JQX30_21335 [Saccharopolyspora erythraea]CAM03452.1 hypothetical protein SACE_4183 [Saccharopolyspora erythraea NRRL 2338]
MWFDGAARLVMSRPGRPEGALEPSSTNRESTAGDKKHVLRVEDEEGHTDKKGNTAIVRPASHKLPSSGRESTALCISCLPQAGVMPADFL